MTDNAKTAIYIETYGCQMNVYDSDRVRGLLQTQGYAFVDAPEDADVVLINTCSVREHAESRVLGRLHQVGALHKKRLRLLGVIGCMAERLKEDLFRQAPEVDFVVGPGSLEEIPLLLEEMLPSKTAKRGVFGTAEHPMAADRGWGTLSDFVAISRGCDNWCSYCIVPAVRGPEISRPVADILAEVRAKVASGTREITLLGQNVNSYRDGEVDFPELLQRVEPLDGLWRIRFATSHPKDFSDRLIAILSARGKVMPQLHLPAQSGSDRILAAMNRRYTAAHYLERVRLAREAIPDLHLTTDLIVGFPGETEADFEATLELVRAARFDNAFTFRYSPRPGTASVAMEDDVPESTKIARLERLIGVIRRQAQSRVKALLGTEQEVLVTGANPRGPGVRGQIPSGRYMILEGEYPIGVLVRTRVTSIKGATLMGERLESII